MCESCQKAELMIPKWSKLSHNAPCHLYRNNLVWEHFHSDGDFSLNDRLSNIWLDDGTVVRHVYFNSESIVILSPYFKAALIKSVKGDVHSDQPTEIQHQLWQ